MTVWGLWITKGVDIVIVIIGFHCVNFWCHKVGFLVDFLGDQIWTDSVQKIGAL
jgi:hypothetical protein